MPDEKGESPLNMALMRLIDETSAPLRQTISPHRDRLDRGHVANKVMLQSP